MCDHSSPLHRARSSPYEAVSVTFAENAVLDQCHEPEKEEIIGSKLTMGRIVAEDIQSQDDLPPVRTSIMDGYAIKCEGEEKYRENRPLKVIGISCAGEPTRNRVESGTCARISTGAPVPEGADAVIKVENTNVTQKSDTEELEIMVDEEVFPGHNIREPGSDISKGQLLLNRGSTIHPAELGVLLAAGWGHRPVTVYKKPKIVVMSTGSELVDPSESDITTSSVRDTNRPQLLALFNKHGAEAIDGGIGVDTREAMIDCIVRSFCKADIVVSSGSVSMGERDLLKNILEKNFDFKIHFGRIMMKPGLPCTFASGVFEGRRKLFFALPGNPVSSLVCAQLFVLPALYKMSGRGEGAAHHRILVKLTEDVSIGDRPEFMRGVLTFSVDPFDLSPKVQLFHNQRSSRLLSAVGSNVLVEMPSCDQHGSKFMEKGTIVKAIIMGSIGNS